MYTHTDFSTHPVAHPWHRYLELDGNQLLCTLAGSGALRTCTCNAGSSGPSFNCTSCVAGKYKSLTASAPCTDCIYNMLMILSIYIYIYICECMLLSCFIYMIYSCFDPDLHMYMYICICVCTSFISIYMLYFWWTSTRVCMGSGHTRPLIRLRHVIPHKCGACGCSRPYRLTGLLVSVHQSEGLRRDGAWEHAVLQQRAAGEAPLDEAADVCRLLISSAAPLDQEACLCTDPCRCCAGKYSNIIGSKACVGCFAGERCMSQHVHAAGASYDAHLPNLVSRRGCCLDCTVS